jgi:DNA-binding winged helix-turn-helix (wHTH) protein
MRVRFADFVLDPGTRQLLRGRDALHLEPKAFELLALLVERRPAAVSKSAIQTQLWPNTFVSEGNVTGLVTQIRQALQDDRAQARFVRTVHGFGYAFCADAQEEPLAPRRILGRVVWDRRVLPLHEGENVLGRAEDAAVRIDAQGVSRQHALLRVTERDAAIEDLGSKNGTHVGDRRIAAPAALEDGDVFRLGSEVLVFRRTAAQGSTATEPDAQA